MYKYIYYWLYTWQRKLWGENDVPEFNAVAGMSLSFMCNLGSLHIIINLIFGVKIFSLDLPKTYVIISLIIILLAHYYAFMHRGKYLEIEKEFKQESKRDRKRKGFLVLLYTFGSMAFYIFLLFFGIWYNNNFK